MSTVPLDNFNWIQERVKCSASKLFELLRQQVSQDVKCRNKLIPPLFEGEQPPRHTHGFSMTETGDSFTVSLDSNQVHKKVTFVRGDRTIEIKGTDGTGMFQAVPSLNAIGECVMVINKQEYPIWYLRKMALESLFFDHYSPLML